MDGPATPGELDPILSQLEERMTPVPESHPALPVLPDDPPATTAGGRLVSIAGKAMPDRDPNVSLTSTLPPKGIAILPGQIQKSILERKITLAELLDLNAFRDVCASFVDLYKIGIKIFDVDGTKLVDVRVGNGDWCGYIFQNQRGRAMCTALVTKIKQFDYPGLPDGDIVEQECFSGLKYVIMPITYGGDLLGRVIYGPFLPQHLEEPGITVRGFGEGFDPKQLWQYGHKIRRAPDETIIKILTNFRSVVDSITFVAIKSLMTQHMHLESITASYNELSASNRALRESVEKLRELDRLKSSFLAMISHELRTPLTSVIGYSEMLLEGMAGEINEEQRNYLKTIQEKGDGLLGMIGGLLDVAKIEAGAFALEMADFELKPVIEGATSSVVPQAQKKNIQLQVDVQPDLPAVHGDPDRVRQCIVNLLGNAVKFTPKDGKVSLVASVWVGPRKFGNDPDDRFGAPDERFLRIDVIDTGIGIPDDKLSAVFNAFYQVDNSITREYGGTGLGLSIVKRFVEAHKGEVWVESRVAVGTKFSLLIPLDNMPSGTVPVLPAESVTGHE